MSQYSFTTNWRFEAPIESVWDEIYHPERWPNWWSYVLETIEIDPGDDLGVGSVWRHLWKTKLPYKLKFDITVTKVGRPNLLEAKAEGELSGIGIWNLSSEENITLVKYDWIVETTKPWMKYLAQIDRPLFEWNHEVVMKEGIIGLSNVLKNNR